RGGRGKRFCVLQSHQRLPQDQREDRSVRHRPRRHTHKGQTPDERAAKARGRRDGAREAVLRRTTGIFNRGEMSVQMQPEHIAKALLHESFSSRRTVVILFVLINAAVLTVGWFWPKGFTASTSILVEEKNIIQPLMQGAAVATEVADRSKNVREVIFGRK